MEFLLGSAGELIGRSGMGNSGEEKMIGRSVRRLEDGRFLTGHGRYVADIAHAAALHGHVLRSPHAHALIERIDVSRGASLAGVQGIYTAADLAADGLGPLPCMAAVKPLIVPPRPALAVGRVRHVGDPVAFIVADSEEIAREAAELQSHLADCEATIPEGAQENKLQYLTKFDPRGSGTSEARTRLFCTREREKSSWNKTVRAIIRCL
jgi:xanthine dehydrogenase molybdopterin-binding subunit B